MPKLIVHHDGYFFEWSTVTDAPCTTGASRAEFEEYYREQYGEQGARSLPERLDRAIKYGTSSIEPMSVHDLIAGNRAGPNETELSLDEIIRIYCIEQRFPSP